MCMIGYINQIDKSIYVAHTVSFISKFAIANFKPVGSRPIAKQNRITCITGSAKMNSITPTLRHIRKKFFCSRARILPFVVIYANQMYESIYR